jgi:chemotaxis protein CheD
LSQLKEQITLVYLKPGEMFFSDEPAVVETVLGSCLSVTMFHRQRRLGAICHGILPICGEQKECHGNCLEGFKYVDCSIHRMAQIFDRYKVPRGRIEVKCFGGADMFTRQIEGPGIASIGRRNIIAAQKILTSEGLKLDVQDVGGFQGRKIFFHTHTGKVLLKRLKRAEAANLT